VSARKKSTSESSSVAVADAPAGAPGRTRMLAFGMIVIVAVGLGYVVWQQVRGHVLSSTDYQLEPQKIVITPAPAWIRADVKAEVLRDAGFNAPLSLLDEELTLHLASAFAAHPWVAHVVRVSKRYPAGLEVTLAYRKPVAMVEVQSDSALPVDVQGVVLPSGDFDAAEAALYPRIGEIHTTPSGPVGTRWGDPCVAGAAQIAAVVAADWKSLDFFRIVPAGRKPGGRNGVEYAYSILTHSGTKVVWGRAPSTDLPGELPSDDKLAALRRYAAENHGTLDGPHGAQEIIIRDSGDLLVQPRPPIKSLPKTAG
jgi:hypothetical protein